MKEDYQQLFKPEIINKVSGLALISRVIVEGYLSGLNRSRRVGTGMEFSQYRGYEPGDDLRMLDWKMLARSGRYYIKQAEVETNINVKFILDASNSMRYAEEGISKMEYARVLVASLAYLAKSQGDAVGLFALNDHKLYSLFPRLQKQHFNRILLELISINAEGKWPENPVSSEKIHDRRHKELIFFITDMYEYNDELTAFIKRLKTSRNEVVVLQILGKNEVEFNYKGPATFEDLETGVRIKVDTKAVKNEYLKSIQNQLTTIKDELLANAIGYESLRLDEPLGEALQTFLKKRTRLL
ncbi:MAG: DUF58 domain-containing protein [Leeuwenhoekiella sp.]